MLKLSIIIPVYNEAATVEKLMEKVLAVKLPKLTKEIIIVESNSTDGTREIIKKYEKKKNIKIIYQDKSKGKGNAVKEGLQHASGDIVLIQDADLEYNPAEYGRLLQPILDGKTSFVLGSRPMGLSTWKIRFYFEDALYQKVLNYGGILYTLLFNLLYLVWITDPATMYKVFRKDCLEHITLRSNYFDLDWELVAKLVRKGYKPIEVPISYNSRSLAEGKKIRFFRDGFLVFLAIIRFRFFD